MMRRVRPATQPIYPDFEGQYTSMPCDGPSRCENFHVLRILETWKSDRLERLKRSEAVEPFDRTQGRLFGTSGTGSVFGKHQGITHSARLKKGIRKILTGTSVSI